jgi:hypothetical protein
MLKFLVPLGILAILGAILASTSMLIAPTTTRGADISLETSSREVAQGQVFQVTVKVQPNGEEVSLVDAFLSFSAGNVEVLNLEPGIALDRVLASRYDNKAGSVDFSAATLGTPATGEFVLAVVAFRAIAPAEMSRIEFSSILPRKTEIAFRSNSVLRNTQGVGVRIVPGS